jgi:4-deoxy-L-threo-5-hexosulose-uronate ketol-isomerase
MHYLPDRERSLSLSTEALREAFLVTDLFREGLLTFRVTDLDRVILGGAVPTDGPIEVEPPEATTTEHLTDRRELGILNIGGEGSIDVGGTSYDLAPLSCLYVGKGSGEITLKSVSSSNPAVFYLVSYPCAAEYPTSLVTKDDVEPVRLGSDPEANRRRLYKYIHPEGIKSGQLVMGITVLEEGNVWNTMPPHTHDRRSEVYLYFGLEAPNLVMHFMGTGEETRHLVIRNRQAVLSPPWSIHAGAGTSAYMFCWAMGGENQAFSDMDAVPLESLR